MSNRHPKFLLLLLEFFQIAWLSIAVHKEWIMISVNSKLKLFVSGFKYINQELRPHSRQMEIENKELDLQKQV